MTHHDQPTAATKMPVVDVFPVQPENGQDDGDGEEYLVDIDTHQTVLVRNATSPEDAVVKAVTGNPEGCDFDQDVVAHDVHVCIHTGMSDEDHVGHEAEE